MLKLGLVTPVLLSLTSAVAAAPMDPALSRLVRDTACTASGAPCLPDRAAYHKLVSQWGVALGPNAVHEARTTGLAGFSLSLTGALTGIDEGADYWRRGTRGDQDRGGGAAPLNTDPDGFLSLYSLELRKGIGLGIEAAASVGIMPNTSLVSFGGDLRVALLEGMRTGSLRYLPDVSLGAAVREATGLRELTLRTLALEARVSRPLAARSGFIITPWLGYQWLRIDADSALVDLTPATDALEGCGYVGTNVPGMPGVEPDAPEPSAPVSGAPPGVFDGSLVCEAAGGRDYASSVAFGEAAVQRHRLLFGASYRHEVLKIGAEVITDLLRPDAAQSDAAVARALRCDAEGENCRSAPRQWTLVVQLGAAF